MGESDPDATFRPTINSMRYWHTWYILVIYVSFRRLRRLWRLRGIWSQVLYLLIADFDENEVHLMGPVWWIFFFFLILPMIKSDQMFLLASFFHRLMQVIENAFVRDLGCIIQRYMGYRLGNDGSRVYALATLVYSMVHRLLIARRGRVSG